MTMPKKKHFSNLRQRAENVLEASSRNNGYPVKFSKDHIKTLIHDLQVHQVKLEMQNDELKRSQEKLETAQARYLDFFNMAPVGFFSIDEQNIILECNLTAATLLGRPLNKIVKQPMTQFILKEDQDIYYLYNKQVFETEMPQGCNLRMQKNDGSAVWVNLTTTVVQNAEGITSSRIVMSDITERKKAEVSLRESNDRHTAMIANNCDVIGIIGADGIIEYISSNIERWFGWKPEDLVGTDGWKTVHPEDIERLQKEFHAGIEKDNFSTTVEYRNKCKDGSYRWIELTAVNCVNDPAINGGLLNYHDISERKRTEEALQESEARFRTLFESVPTPVQGYNSDGTIHFWNKACEKIYGYTKEEAIGKNLIDLIIPPEMHDFVRKAIKQGSKTGEMPPTEELSLMQKDGSLVPVLSSHALVKLDGKEPELYCLDIDMRLQKKLESQLQQVQKMESIGTLAGGIAHDFNNILSPILGYTEMLLEDVPEDSPFKDSLNPIYTSALRAQSLVKQILTFSRQKSSELILMKIQPIIKEALKLIRSTIPTTIEIIQDISPDCGVIKADPTQIHQIVMNLATNAYHAMEEKGGELKVSLKQIELGEYDIITPDMAPGVYACLTVADTGVGMDKKLTDKIFDPFFTTKAIGRGTGMGLSVVHGIVLSMGGTIHVYSEPGKGTQFHVYLPIEKSFSETQVTQATIPIRGGTEHILFVDDEEVILQMETLMLERLGYQVTSRTSSLEALEAFRKNPDKFDLVITDLAMPNMAGDKLSAELTKIRPDIPVLLCTGFSEKMSEEKATSMGIKGFLLKPIIMKDLAQKIRKVLDK